MAANVAASSYIAALNEYLEEEVKERLAAEAPIPDVVTSAAVPLGSVDLHQKGGALLPAVLFNGYSREGEEGGRQAIVGFMLILAQHQRCPSWREGILVKLISKPWLCVAVLLTGLFCVSR